MFTHKEIAIRFIEVFNVFFCRVEKWFVRQKSVRNINDTLVN